MSSTVLGLVFSLAAVSQAPASDDPNTEAARQKAFSQEISRRNATPKAKAKTEAKPRNEAERQKARRRARSAAAQERERVEFERNSKLRAQAAEEYRRMLPLLLEKQRLELERMSAFERNVALNRIANANMAAARAINNLAGAEYYAAFNNNNNNNNNTHPNNATPAYGPFGIGMTPAVQGAVNANPTINAAAVYNNIFPVGGVSGP